MAGKIIEASRDEEIYAERVHRSQIFLGRNAAEQKKSQKILSECTIGIAGTGGIGGAMALRLARLGVKKIKIADPQEFDISNINRQLGATVANAGRNKAEVVGEIVSGLAGDVEIEVYNEGITVENAEEFVADCDLILDQLEFYVIKEKYALHRAFRKSKKAKNILTSTVVGYSIYLMKYTPDSMTVEDWYEGIAENADTTDDVIDKLLKLWCPKFPHFPSYDTIRDWIKQNDTVPIFAGTPPLAEGILIQRIALCLLDQEYPPYAKWLPPVPQMYVYDAATLSGEMVTSAGKILNLEELEVTWDNFDSSDA